MDPSLLVDHGSLLSSAWFSAYFFTLSANVMAVPLTRGPLWYLAVMPCLVRFRRTLPFVAQTSTPLLVRRIVSSDICMISRVEVFFCSLEKYYAPLGETSVG